MLNVKSLAETLQVIRDNFRAPDTGTQTVALCDAAGRTLADDITARDDNPPYTRSSLDGYAVRASDTFGASEAIPAMLTQAVYVPTGWPLPPDTDAIAMIEIAETLGEHVLINSGVAPGTGVVYRGEDAKAGDVVMTAGQMLSPRHVGALAALGYAEVPVKKRIKCAVISTGDEIVPIESAGIRDVNSHMLCAQIKAFGCDSVSYGIYPDDEAALSAVVQKAYAECDVVLVSGGSSAGVMDMTKHVFQKAAGAEILAHGVAIKPGKPTIVAKSGQKALIGLPGHPVSAFFVMLEVVRPLLLPDKPRPYIIAKLGEKIPSNHGREDFVPVRLDGDTAQTVSYKSGLITLLSQSDGYIRIPRLAEGLDCGAQVKVFCYEI